MRLRLTTAYYKNHWVPQCAKLMGRGTVLESLSPCALTCLNTHNCQGNKSLQADCRCESRAIEQGVPSHRPTQVKLCLLFLIVEPPHHLEAVFLETFS